MSRSKDVTNDEILPQSERLQALSPEEYELLWGHPVFSDSDRDLFFQLNSRELAYLIKYFAQIYQQGGPNIKNYAQLSTC